jgi:hypothetical protein
MRISKSSLCVRGRDRELDNGDVLSKVLDGIQEWSRSKENCERPRNVEERRIDDVIILEVLGTNSIHTSSQLNRVIIKPLLTKNDAEIHTLLPD